MGSDVKNWFEISISRGPITGALRNTVGLLVHVHADSAIEEFFRTQSGGQTNVVELFGQTWVSVEKGQQVEAYRCPKLPSNQFSLGRYTIEQVSRPLLTSNRDDGLSQFNMVNLSFLKLVGISKPEGVRFGVIGAYSIDYIANLNRQLTAEVKQFLLDYITPVNVNLKIVSK